MKKGGTGGGNTITGLIYEAKVDLGTFLNRQQDYKVNGFDVFYKEKLVAKLFKKHGLYEYLKSVGVDWTKHISQKLLPDNCIYVIVIRNCLLSSIIKLSICIFLIIGSRLIDIRTSEII